MCAYCVAMTESDHPATTPIGALHEIVIGALCVDETGAFQVCADPEGNEWCLVDDAPGT